VDYKLEWTDRARDDLREIVGVIATARPSAVASWGDGLFRQIEVLASFPLIGPVVPRVSTLPTRRIVVGDYLVFYRVLENPRTVQILTLWHGARGLPDFL
jgi:toxin ParE1/3/4